MEGEIFTAAWNKDFREKSGYLLSGQGGLPSLLLVVRPLKKCVSSLWVSFIYLIQQNVHGWPTDLLLNFKDFLTPAGIYYDIQDGSSIGLLLGLIDVFNSGRIQYGFIVRIDRCV